MVKGKNILPVLVTLLVLSSMITPALAEENEAPKVTGGSTAIGFVNVTLVEWEPSLEGLGAGMFTYTQFDFGKFFQDFVDALSGLFGFQ